MRGPRPAPPPSLVPREFVMQAYAVVGVTWRRRVAAGWKLSVWSCDWLCAPDDECLCVAAAIRGFRYRWSGWMLITPDGHLIRSGSIVPDRYVPGNPNLLIAHRLLIGTRDEPSEIGGRP